MSGSVTTIGLAAFEPGQRVFVLRDCDGGAIGKWGTVARMRRGDHGAWVRLDARHERCPFGPEDANRSTNILTYPESCASFEPGEATP